MAVSGCIGASVAVTHVLPASESDDVTHVLVRAHQGGAADPALQIRATGAVASYLEKPCRVGGNGLGH
jgi:hypothetical protein